MGKGITFIDWDTVGDTISCRCLVKLLIMMRVEQVLAVLCLVAAASAFEAYFRMPAPYSYTCEQQKCMRYDRNHKQQHMHHHDQEVHDQSAPSRNARHLTNEPHEHPHVSDDHHEHSHEHNGVFHTHPHEHNEEYNTLAECQLTCGEYGALWPRPSNKVELAKRTVSFTPMNLRFTKLSASSNGVQQMLDEASHYFKRNLHFMHPDYPKDIKGPFTQYEEDDMNDKNEFEHRYEKKTPFKRQKASPLSERQYFDVEITVTQTDTQLSLNTDESYDMSVQTRGDTTTATILASTYYGARHALETLSQLIAYDEINNSLMVVSTALISDEPAFSYRGMMLDTGRNFYPKDEIMSLLDTMATNKLNTFHWHISDSASFPMYSQRQPQMTYYGAYSPSKVYYPEDIREIVNYANLRGIRVIPELDAPAHAGAGWNFGEKSGKGKLVLCNDQDTPWFENCKEPPCGQLNPTNPEVYNVLKDLYKDIIEAFNPEFVHMGGDDTSFKCWSNSPEIIDFMRKQEKEVNTRELFDLWNTFQSNAYSKLFEASEENSRTVTPMIYSSSFVRNFIDPKKYIVQLTNKVNDTNIQSYISNGYKVVFSNADVWNFEGPAQSWVSEVATFRENKRRPSWEHVYENSPLDMLVGMGYQTARSDNVNQRSNEDQQVLGGEAMLWSYETDSSSLQTTAWPRGAALAERLWTDPMSTQFQAQEVKPRMAAHRQRMVERGTRAETFQPEYCYQNQDSCYSQDHFTFRQTNN